MRRHLERPRTVLAATFLVVASAILWIAVSLGPGDKKDLLLNLGSELTGIVITVAIVDWLFERRRNADEADELPIVDVVLGHGRAVAADEERFLRRAAEKIPRYPFVVEE